MTKTTEQPEEFELDVYGNKIPKHDSKTAIHLYPSKIRLVRHGKDKTNNT